MRHWLAISLILPGAAFACALPPSVVMTLPTGYYMAAAAATVAITAILAIMPQHLPTLQARTISTARPLTGIVTSYLSFLVFLALLIIGFIGASDPMHNLLTLTVWVGVWVVLPMASMLFGNLWRILNPWTAPVRITRILLGRTGRAGLGKLGHLPAVLGLLGFFWFYIVSLSPDDPQTLALTTTIYWLVIYAAAVAEGEEWLDQGEFLTVYFALLSRIAPLWTEVKGNTSQLRFGWPGTQVLNLPSLSPSAIAFVTLALAGLTFDGLSATFWWMALIGENPLEFTGRSAVIGVNTVGLLGTWALTAATILMALRLGPVLAQAPQMVTAGGAGHPPRILPDMSRVTLSFLAIAAGYHAAHYLVTLLSTGQYFIAALNDPLFRGDSFLGLNTFFVSMGFLADRSLMIAVWNTQFALIVGAHVLALILGLRLSPVDLPARAHLPLTILMIAYTVLGLWLLSSPTSF